VALGRLHAAALTLTAPLDYQAIQRENRDGGTIVVQGGPADAETKDVTLEARIITNGKSGEWRKLLATFTSEEFSARMEAPAGNWHRLEVRTLCGDRTLAGGTVAHVGVGEVFVVAGQFNAANYGQERQSAASCRLLAMPWRNALAFPRAS
jgi:hypothetical protein